MNRTESSSKVFDVCVVGGAGHVGMPLSVVLANHGLRTLIYDLNAAVLEQLRRGEVPFTEEGCEPMLKRALAEDMLGFTTEPAGMREVKYVVLSIGTPVDEFHNPVLHTVTDCVDKLLPYLSDDQTIVLRSTVFPGMTEYLHQYLAKRGRHPKIAFCPERVVQGQAIKEIQTLTQIVSGVTPEAEEAAAALFGRFAPKLTRMVPTEAEFAKLICNAYRYIQFAAANQFYMMAEEAGLDYDRILRGLKQDYPRMRDLPGPGFAAGPCLMKDTLQLFASSNNQFMLGQMAMMVNEGLPSFVVEQLSKRHDLTKVKVGILGMAFKSDVDDIRDSLSYKLGKILRFRGATVLYSDEFVKDPVFVTKEELIAQCDVVIVGVQHTAYKGLRFPDRVDVVDLWAIGKKEAA